MAELRRCPACRGRLGVWEARSSFENTRVFTCRHCGVEVIAEFSILRSFWVFAAPFVVALPAYLWLGKDFAETVGVWTFFVLAGLYVLGLLSLLRAPKQRKKRKRR